MTWLCRWAGGPCCVVGQVDRITSLGRWTVLRRWAGGPGYGVGQVDRAKKHAKNTTIASVGIAKRNQYPWVGTGPASSHPGVRKPPVSCHRVDDEGPRYARVLPRPRALAGVSPSPRGCHTYRGGMAHPLPVGVYIHHTCHPTLIIMGWWAGVKELSSG